MSPKMRSRLSSNYMKRTCLFAFALLGSLASVRGSDDGQKQPVPPENLYFETDEFIKISKYTVTVGARQLSGVKTSFTGKGSITQPNGRIFPYSVDGNPTLYNPSLVYNDGTVGVDTRATPRYDTNGQPLFNSAGTPATNPYATIDNQYTTPDGKTNNWSADFASQYTPSFMSGGGTVAMHAYSAQTIDDGPLTGKTAATSGMEVSIARDMSERGKRFTWSFLTGLGLNDIRSCLTTKVRSDVTTITDLYEVTPRKYPSTTADAIITTPYTGGQTTSIGLTDQKGVPVMYTSGNGLPSSSQINISVDNSHLLLVDRLSRSTTVINLDTTSVLNSYKVKGAFYTMRFGPSMTLSLTESLRLSLSAGFALAYASETFTINSDFTPAETDAYPFTIQSQDTAKHVLPGYFVDANIEYWLTDDTGFYAGSVYQNNGSYKHKVDSTVSDYTSRIDLSRMSGFRAGMNYRF